MKIKVALIQSTASGNPQENLKKAIRNIENACSQGANIICQQELFLTPYFCQKEDASLFRLAEPIPGPTTNVLCSLAARLGCVIITSLFEKRVAGIYHNTAAVIDADGTLLGKYRKMHIPDDPLYYEKYYFTPGDLGYRTWKTRFGNLGVLVCWDQWYPEAARLTALSGAQILFYPTAIGWLNSEKEQFGTSQHCAWETVQRGHGVANNCYVVSVNRVGPEGELTFWGGSFVSNPFGEVVARASHEEEAILITECDLEWMEEVRVNWPFFRDRRIETYGDLQKRYLD